MLVKLYGMIIFAVFLTVPTFADEGCIDLDEDGYGIAGVEWCPYPELDCDDSDPNVYPGSPELCNGIDDDCDEIADDVDWDGDGYIDEECGGDDCDDYSFLEPFPCYFGDFCDSCEDPACGSCSRCVHPGAVEWCFDPADSDCDGISDENEPGCLPLPTLWKPAGSADASVYSSASPQESGISNLLGILLIPAGVLIVLKALRKRK